MLSSPRETTEDEVERVGEGGVRVDEEGTEDEEVVEEEKEEEEEEEEVAAAMLAVEADNAVEAR
jgi:hypothetical protein